jgi:F-type H+-transporting ATPase subunit epsilon
MMRLLITEPMRVVVDDVGVASVRAEDASGSFGILPGHTDLVTALTPSVVAWQLADGRRRWCAVRRGVLSITAGQDVVIATRQGECGDDPALLEEVVRAHLEAARDSERQARVAATKLHTAAIREIIRALRPVPHTQNGGPP